MRRVFGEALAHRLLLTGVILVVGGLGGWYLWDPSGSQVDDKFWTEDVQLASGDALQVKRRVRFREGTAYGGGYSTGQTFETSELEWSGDSGNVIRWSAPMRALFLDHDPDTGEWIIVAVGSSDAFYQLNGAPCPPQWAFRWREDTWYVEPVPVNVIGRRPNLLFDLRVSDDRRFPYPQFGDEVLQRKTRFELHPRPDEVRLFTIGAVGNISRCEGVSPGFTKPFTVNETIPGIDNFARMSE